VATSYATLVPNVGPFRNQGHTATSQHQPFPHGSGAQQRTGVAFMGNRLLLKNPATSLEQSSLRPGHASARKDTSRGPTLREGDGGSSHAAWWRVALPVDGPGPSRERHHGLAANPLPSPSRQPGDSHTQRHLRHLSLCFSAVLCVLFVCPWTVRTFAKCIYFHCRQPNKTTQGWIHPGIFFFPHTYCVERHGCREKCHIADLLKQANTEGWHLFEF